jgi:hypothetical protein
MKNFSLYFIVFLFASTLSLSTIAQDSEPQQADSVAAESTKPQFWKLGGGVNLNFNQVSLSNWTGGGNSSIAFGGLVNLFAEYEKDNHAWVNRATLAYGVLRQGERDVNQVQKTDDQLILISRYKYRLVKSWSVSGNIDFRTQIDDGFRYGPTPAENVLFSGFMAPGYLLANIGISYRFKDIFALTLSPVSSRTTFVLKDQIDPTSYGLEDGERVRFQGGFTVIASIRKKLMENVDLVANTNIFTDYEDFWPFDVNAELIINMKVNKFITASLSTQYVYDNQVVFVNSEGTSIEGPHQFKNVIAVGFAYSFRNFKE